MSAQTLSDDLLNEALELVRLHGNPFAASVATGIPRTTLRDRYHKALKRLDAGADQEVITPPDLPSGDYTKEELVERQTSIFERRIKAHDARKIIPINIKSNQPIGITWLGDPHVDDDGCNWPKLRSDVRLIKETDGLYGANLGDSSNNWIGRLQRLYACQNATEAQAWKLVEWLMEEVPWLILLRGNHDAWSGAGSPISWMNSRATVDEDWRAKVQLRFPNAATYTFDARHDHPGHSQWNALHGQRKAALFEANADCYIAGHRHNWATSQFEEQGRVVTLLRARGYKHIDHFALTKGYPEQDHGQSVTTIIDPTKPQVSRCKVFVEAEEAADYLTYLRSR